MSPCLSLHCPKGRWRRAVRCNLVQKTPARQLRPNISTSPGYCCRDSNAHDCIQRLSASARRYSSPLSASLPLRSEGLPERSAWMTGGGYLITLGDGSDPRFYNNFATSFLFLLSHLV